MSRSTIYNDEMLKMAGRPLEFDEYWVIQAPDGDIFPRTASKIMIEPIGTFVTAFDRPDRPIKWADCERQGFRLVRKRIPKELLL